GVANGFIFATKAKEIGIHFVNGGVSPSLREIEFAAAKGFEVAGLGKNLAALRTSNTAELVEKLAATFADEFVQFFVVIGKEEKRTGGGELLSLKNQRSARMEKSKRG